jgi:hypothetical protein
MPVLYSGVASFKAVPVELFFAQIKRKFENLWYEQRQEEIKINKYLKDNHINKR